MQRTVPFILLSLIMLMMSLEAESFLDLFPPAGKKKGKKTATKQTDEEMLIREETEEEKLIDAFVLRHVKFASDWNPDPTALPQFTYQFRKALRMRCQMVDEPLELSDPEIFKWPMLWMHAHNSFKFTKIERKHLKKYLQQGGVIIADDCSSGGGGFMPSFRAEFGRIFPGKAFKVILPDDKRFKGLFDISYQFQDTFRSVSELHNEVLLVNDRIGIYVIHDDYGCQWEVSSPPTSANPLGNGMHGFTSVQRKGCFQFSFNVMLYLMTH